MKNGKKILLKKLKNINKCGGIKNEKNKQLNLL